MIPSISRADAPLLARRYFEGEGEPSPLAAKLAHVPELLDVALPFFEVVYGPTALPDRLKEIVVLRTSALNACRYYVRVHAALAAGAGLADAELAYLHRGTGMPSTFADSERAAFAFAEAMCVRPADAASLLQPFFRADQIVELAVLASTTTLLNRFCTAIGIA